MEPERPVSPVNAMVDFTRTSVGLIPLTDLGAGTYQGFQGGLYPGGTNEPPAAYQQRRDSAIPGGAALEPGRCTGGGRALRGRYF